MEIPMSDPAHIAERYIAVWNETDAQRRQRLLADTWTPDATYVDPLQQSQGLDQISAMIGAVHDRFPGFTFALHGEADGYGDYVRFSWGLGPAGADAPIKGSDVAVLTGGRLCSIIGFLDQVPG
jgi:hypothetical protein